MVETYFRNLSGPIIYRLMTDHSKLKCIYLYLKLHIFIVWKRRSGLVGCCRSGSLVRVQVSQWTMMLPEWWEGQFQSLWIPLGLLELSRYSNWFLSPRLTESKVVHCHVQLLLFFTDSSLCLGHWEPGFAFRGTEYQSAYKHV